MPSFDILSKVDVQTLDNAINTAKRELDTRYDLRGSNSTIDFDKKALTIQAGYRGSLEIGFHRGHPAWNAVPSRRWTCGPTT
ncbi:MAG: DUF520 family protein [Dermatophilaceae bacterium]